MHNMVVSERRMAGRGMEWEITRAKKEEIQKKRTGEDPRLRRTLEGQGRKKLRLSGGERGQTVVRGEGERGREKNAERVKRS